MMGIRNSNFRQFYSILLIFFIFFQMILIIPNQEHSSITKNATGDTVVDYLSNGNTEKTITFGAGGGSDSSAKLYLPKGSEVLSASFNVSGTADNQNNYPTDVKVDVGDDGDPEWEFNISGVGSLGKQTEFIGSIDHKYLVLSKGDFDNSLKLRIPRNANILSTNLKAEGYFHGVPNGNFSTGTMLGWTTITDSYGDTVVVSNARGGNNPPSSWGASGYYLMLRSNPYNSQDDNCNLVVKSDKFPKFDTNYITMDWDLVEHDNFNLDLALEDSVNSPVIAREFGGDNGVHHTETRTKQVIDITSLTGNNLNIRLRLWDGDSIIPWWNDWGRVAVDNLYISDQFGNPKPNFPTNFSLDFGNDGTQEVTIQSLNGKKPVTGFKSSLSSLLNDPSPGCEVTVDNYGNEFLDIPINITVISSPGIINITDLKIEYEYTAQVNKNPRGTLTDELNSLIPASGKGNVTIPIGVWSTTAGKLKISDINIKYNAKPNVKTIPTIEILEDSLNPKKIDLTNYFSDDSHSEELIFEVASNSAPDKLQAIIEDGNYLTLNTNLIQNWNGDVSITLRATDNRGLITESNTFIVRVVPVNDEPTVNINLDKYTLLEDSPGITISLDNVPYFVDVEGDDLFYHIDIDPYGIFPDIELNLHIYIDENNIINIKPSDNWFGYNVPILLFCDDDENPIDKGPSAPQQQFFVDVLPINDPPVLESFDPIYLDEDVSIDNYVNLEEKASDIETTPEDLKYKILSNDNEENILVSIDELNQLDISILTNDYIGTAKIKLQVEDEDGATASESFKIFINSINDGPRVLEYPDVIKILEDTEDSTSLNLFDVFYDPDSSMTFTVTGNEHISVLVSQEDGSVTFKPDKDWFGIEHITFTALDSYFESGGIKKSEEIIVNVTVLPVNDAPQTPTILSPLEPRANPRSHAVSFKADDAVDVDSTNLTYYWDFDNRVDSDDDGDPTNDQNGIGQQVDHRYAMSGYYYVTLYVSDGELNCSPAAGIYVKITTNVDKVTEELVKKSSTFETEVLLSLPFIILILLLILWILLIRRKMKSEKSSEPTRPPHRSIPPEVIDGELVSEPKLPPKAKVMIVPETPRPPQPRSQRSLAAQPATQPTAPPEQPTTSTPSPTPKTTQASTLAPHVYSADASPTRTPPVSSEPYKPPPSVET